MKPRKHPRQKKKSYQPNRRRKTFMRIAAVAVFLMALSLIASSYTNKVLYKVPKTAKASKQIPPGPATQSPSSGLGF